MQENKNFSNLVKDFEDIRISAMLNEVQSEEATNNFCDNFIEIDIL